jgi:hypothetical protein
LALRIAHGHESSLVELPTLSRRRHATRIESARARDGADSAEKEQQHFSARRSQRIQYQDQVLDNASKLKAVMECLRHIVILIDSHRTTWKFSTQGDLWCYFFHLDHYVAETENLAGSLAESDLYKKNDLPLCHLMTDNNFNYLRSRRKPEVYSSPAPDKAQLPATARSSIRLASVSAPH